MTHADPSTGQEKQREKIYQLLHEHVLIAGSDSFMNEEELEEAIVDLIRQETTRFYRKGWQHIVDGETPPVPDLINAEAIDLGNLFPSQ